MSYKKRVKVLCVYNTSGEVFNVVALPSDTVTTIPLYTKGNITKVFSNYSDLYKWCLELVSNNNFEVNTINQFEGVWYDIVFINVDFPASANTFAYLRKEQI